jgi:hypothetical protein
MLFTSVSTGKELHPTGRQVPIALVSQALYALVDQVKKDINTVAKSLFTEAKNSLRVHARSR